MKQIWPAVLLAWIAGFVDALGYLALSHMFTAHMSGNAAALGAQLGRVRWTESLLRGAAIPAFVLGVMAGALSESLAARWRWRLRLAPAFALEFSLLLAFLLLCPKTSDIVDGTWRFFTLVWLLAVAMGVQSATLSRAGGERVRTTFRDRHARPQVGGVVPYGTYICCAGLVGCTPSPCAFLGRDRRR